MKSVPPLVCFAIPTWGKVSIGWSDAKANVQFPLGAHVTHARVVGHKIDDARNHLAEFSLSNNCSHTFFLGDDVLPDPMAVVQLLSRHVDIATGIYWTKTFPKEPYIWRGVQRGPYLQWKHGEFFEVDMAGCDCLLVNNEVFRKVPKPWFTCNWTWEPDTMPGPLTTEDFPFFVHARRFGFRTWADTCVQCGHEDRESGVIFGLTDDMPQARKDVDAAYIQRTDRLCADIGAGHWSEYWDGTLVRYDIDEKTKPDIRCDVRKIPEPAEKFDMVRAHHVLEHLSDYEAPDAVAEWLRILKPGGIIQITVPNLAWAMQTILRREVGEEVAQDELWYAWGTVYGGREPEHQENPAMRHRNGFTERILRNLFAQVGGIKDLEISYTDRPHKDAELCGRATKTTTPKPQVLLNWWNEIHEPRDNGGSGNEKDH